MGLLDLACAEGYYDSWEVASEDARQQTIAHNLDEYVQYCRQLPFYRERLAGYQRGASHPLAAVPVLTNELLRASLPPTGNALVASAGRGHTVFQSGGTTGMPKSVLFSDEELEGLNLPNARGFYAVGLRAGDRVANLFAVGGLYMTFIHINRMLQQYGCTNFPFANVTPPTFVHTVARLFQVNCFTGIASVVLDCLRAFPALGLEGIRIEKVYYGGEHLYEADKRELRASLGVEQIAAPGYGTVESWYLGYQCAACPTGVFHAHDDQAYLEIVDEESGQHVAGNETGMLYVTAFPRRLTPVVRYRVGDRARWIGAPCSCGRTTPLFQLLGRGDDVLRIGYDSIDYPFIQQVVLSFEGLSGTVQMAKQRREGRDQLLVRVETALPADVHASVAAQLAERILVERPSLKLFVEKGTVWPPAIELLAPGGLPRNPRTGKLVRVIDAIKEEPEGGKD